MGTRPTISGSISALKDGLARASGATQPLVYAIIDRTCPRFPNVLELAGFVQLRALIAARAWIDTAFALIKLQLPRWQVRDIYREDDEWHCVVALRWTPSPWLTTVVVARHAALELAILSAYLEAIERAPDLERPLANVVPLRRPGGGRERDQLRSVIVSE